MSGEPVILKDCFALFTRHMALMEEDEQYVPKHHVVLHMLRNSELLGNPTFYSTWLDETLNKTLKAACRETSQATFEASVLYRMRGLMDARVRAR